MMISTLSRKKLTTRTNVGSLVALLFFACSAKGFVVMPTLSSTAIHRSSTTSLAMKASDQNSDMVHDDIFLMDRRNLLGKSSVITTAAVVAFSSSLSWKPSAAYAASTAIGTSADSPVVILGGGGKVGKLCTQMLSDQGIYCKCITRSGRNVLDKESSYVSYGSCDVGNYESVNEAVQGASAVIFGASASGKKKGGDPARVDYLGVYNTAKASIANKVRKLVVVSAGTVTRPDSIGFKATNFAVKFVYGDQIMDYKIAGENLVRDLYDRQSSALSSYTVVRPGGLSDGKAEGPSKTHISQGDVYSSEVTREDVAAVCVACLQTDAADNATFELNTVGRGLQKAQDTLPNLPPELIHAGAPTYVALLEGLKTDKEMLKQYPTIVSTFGGANIKPLNEVV